MKTLDILIPTYNRCLYLEKNIKELKDIINELNVAERIRLVISNNNSSDNTANMLEKFKEKNIVIFQQSINIGLEGNALFCLEKSISDFVMYIGDDDYIEKEYLREVLKYIDCENNLSLIVPSFIGIDMEGNSIESGRDLKMGFSRHNKSFEALKFFAFRGHQLSGLTFRRENIYLQYRENKVSNLYPFIYFTISSVLNGVSLHLPEYPVKVTQVPQTNKDWNYGDDGLLDNIFNNFNCFPELSYKQRVILEQVVLEKQSERYMLAFKKSPFLFFKAVLCSNNTTNLTKVSYIYKISYRIAKYLIKKIKL